MARFSDSELRRIARLQEEFMESGYDSYDARVLAEQIVEAGKMTDEGGKSAFEHFCEGIKRAASWLWGKIQGIIDWIRRLFR